MADSDIISGIENLKSAVSGETPAYQYKDPNTDMMKAISKCIDAADGTIDGQYEYKNPNTDVIRKMDELATAISEGGGGGGSIDFSVSLKDSIKEDSYRNPISFITISDNNFNDYFFHNTPLTYAISKKAMNVYFALKCYEFNGRTDSRSDIILYKNSIEIARCHPTAWEKKIEIGLINLNVGDQLTVGYDSDYWHYGSLSLSSNIDNLDIEIYTN